MSQSLRASAVKLALATTVVLLGAGGMVASVAAASPNQAAGPASPNRVGPPPVDHQLCYGVTATGSQIPAGVVLRNQFSPNGFQPRIGKAVAHCNPVVKTLPSGQHFPITNPRAHLLCYKITAAHQPAPTVVVSNQFGRARLTTGQPNLLCLPSWKSLTGPPHHTAPQPPRLNHFTCYPVKVAAGAYHPPTVGLQDEFANQPVSAQVNPVPVELCLPTEKIVGQHDFPIINPVQHLLCFPVTPTPFKPTVWDQNQFGNETVHIVRTTTLCLPSRKQVVTH
jgi:hypothetical protein